MTSDATAPPTIGVSYARLACGASKSPAPRECAAWSCRMVMSVSNPRAVIGTVFFQTREIQVYLFLLFFF